MVFNMSPFDRHLMTFDPDFKVIYVEKWLFMHIDITTPKLVEMCQWFFPWRMSKCWISIFLRKHSILPDLQWHLTLFPRSFTSSTHLHRKLGSCKSCYGMRNRKKTTWPEWWWYAWAHSWIELNTHYSASTSLIQLMTIKQQAFKADM